MLNNCISSGCAARALCWLFGLSVAVTVFSDNDSGGMNDAKIGVSSEKRDPFWPVGYIPKNVEVRPKKIAPEKVKPSGKYEWGLAMKQLSISGVSSKGKNDFFAVVNGKIKRVGDTISVEYEGITYTWAVESIKPPGSVKLRRVSAL